MKKMKKICKNEKGATAVEYAMIIGLIALVSFLVYKLLGSEVKKIVAWMAYKLMTINP